MREDLFSVPRLTGRTLLSNKFRSSTNEGSEILLRIATVIEYVEVLRIPFVNRRPDPFVLRGIAGMVDNIASTSDSPDTAPLGAIDLTLGHTQTDKPSSRHN